MSTFLKLSAALGELENDVTAGQTTVDLAVGVETVVDTALLLLIQNNLQGLAAVLLGADALADDLDGVDEVGKDGVVDSGQSAGTGALLSLGGARVDGALGAGQDAALSNEEDVAVRELLLELAGQTVEKNFALVPLCPWRRETMLTVDVFRLTAAGSCGSPGEWERGRRQRWPSCRGRPQPIEAY